MIGITIEAVRINGKDKLIESYDDLKEVSELISACIKWGAGGSVSKPDEQASLPLSYRRIRRPRSNRAVDYLMKAVERMEGNFSTSQMADMMKTIGWPTKAKSRRNMLSSVRVLMKADDRFRNLPDGSWVYQKT